jgi:hypothetical protein
MNYFLQNLKLNKHYFIIVICFGLFSCKNTNSTYKVEYSINSPTFLHDVNIALEQDIVHDFFSPPVASRIYLYPNLLAYEIMSSKDSSYTSLTSVFKEFPVFPEIKSDHGHDIAALYGFLKVAEEMVYTTKHIDIQVNKLDSTFKTHPDLKLIKKYSEDISKIMIDWLKKDNYNETRNMGAYQLLNTENSWIPTGPDYMDALEPHWSKIRPVTLDTASQFAPPPPTRYNMAKGSLFYNELMEVYDAVNSRTDSTEAIAKFWDCNPIISRHEGHITYSEKKLTPGGHWMNIYRAAAIKENYNIMESSYVYASLCIGMFDAFISCWEAKYTTNYIRPITVIQNQVDASWTPILYTPNFPEYPSGHSVVSRSAATILTHVFGENYSFVDSTEAPYGMPPRTFSSFYNASQEAAISRLYGGIHYKPAIYNGIDQGSKVGLHVVSKIKLLKK